jgi:hypothetical protein
MPIILKLQGNSKVQISYPVAQFSHNCKSLFEIISSANKPGPGDTCRIDPNPELHHQIPLKTTLYPSKVPYRQAYLPRIMKLPRTNNNIGILPTLLDTHICKMNIQSGPTHNSFSMTLSTTPNSREADIGGICTL